MLHCMPVRLWPDKSVVRIMLGLLRRCFAASRNDRRLLVRTKAVRTLPAELSLRTPARGEAIQMFHCMPVRLWLDKSIVRIMLGLLRRCFAASRNDRRLLVRTKRCARYPLSCHCEPLQGVKQSKCFTVCGQTVVG